MLNAFLITIDLDFMPHQYERRSGDGNALACVRARENKDTELPKGDWFLPQGLPIYTRAKPLTPLVFLDKLYSLTCELSS